MKKKLVALGLSLAMMVSLTACGDAEQISKLNSMSALNAESTVTDNYNLSYTDEQEMIYAQVSNRQLLDLSALSQCSDNEIQQVVNYMNQVDKQLIGDLAVNTYSDSTTKMFTEDLVSDEAVIDSFLTDYLLSFMQQTPYYWQRTKTTVRGIDPKSRSIIVDVTYKTIDFNKEVRLDSTITKGDPDYDKLTESRYNKWLNILNLKLNNPSSPELPALESMFLQYWGDPNVIIEEQSRLSPTSRIYLSGNQETYSGLIDSEAEKTGGSMTVRFVLVPNYVLGINLGLTCEHMYITEYNLDKNITDKMTAFTEEGYQTVTDSVYNLIYSYFTCLDESDFDGLYSLTKNFEGLDKHYEDVFNSTYQKHDGFSVSLFDITGTHIKCGVTISTKERAKNSNMTYPVYTDRYYMELELVGDKLQVANLTLLSRKLEGEPAIDEGEIDTTGFSATITLDNDDKVAIEKLICDFSAIQLNADTTSDKFSDVVDTSITMNQLSTLKEAMTSLSGAQKVVFLQNYQQGTSNYASVKCKELYQDDKNEIVEASATYEFILKGNKWYIYNYTVNSTVKLDTTNLQTTGSLCLVTPGKVVAYTSQIKGPTSTNLDEVSDISKSFNHDSYTPKVKKGVVEQGVVLLKGSDVNESYFKQAANIAGLSTTSKDVFDGNFDKLLGFLEGGEQDYIDVVNSSKQNAYNAIAIYTNNSEARYPDAVTYENEAKACKESLQNDYEALRAILESLGQIPDSEKDVFNTVINDLQNMSATLLK